MGKVQICINTINETVSMSPFFIFPSSLNTLFIQTYAHQFPRPV